MPIPMVSEFFQYIMADDRCRQLDLWRQNMKHEDYEELYNNAASATCAPVDDEPEVKDTKMELDMFIQGL